MNNILYHASIVEVKLPLTHVGRKDLDFGPGFYLTNSLDGIMPAEIALGRLIKEELRHQVCISNQLIIDHYLSFVKSEEL